MKTKAYYEGKRDVLEELIGNLNEARNIADMREWIENQFSGLNIHLRIFESIIEPTALQQAMPVYWDAAPMKKGKKDGR